MVDEFHQWEESLKNFLAEEQEDSYNSRNANLYKYNNLKIFMDPKQNETPHFIVRIRIAEAMYDLEKGSKISGGLGADERYVRKWIDKNISRMDWSILWAKSARVHLIKTKDGNATDEDEAD